MIGTHELDCSSFCLLLTTQLEAKQMSETEGQGDRRHVGRTVCIV